MTSHSLNLANDVVNLTRQQAEIENKIRDARKNVEEHLKEIALAAGMLQAKGHTNYTDIGFYWPQL